MKRLLRLLPPLLLLAFLCCGCRLGGSIEELYSLPQTADEYLELQHAIDGVLASGAVYSAPAEGVHRQSVQLVDLDGDGREEAAAFFATSGEKPLQLIVFRQADGAYERAAVIEGAGTSIESVDYADLDGDGWQEIVVGWGVGGGLKMLELWSLRGFQTSSVAAADYSRYLVADLGDEGRKALAVVSRGTAEEGGSVTLISLTADGETVSVSGRISAGLESVTRLAAGDLRDCSGALFVEGSCSGGLVTDIFTWKNGELKNITLDPVSGVSNGTLRASSAAVQDLLGDGQLLIPMPRPLPAQGETVYRVLDWFGYNSRGRRSLVCTTYHNYSDSWYLTLPDSWGNGITVRREDTEQGERAVVFSRWNGADKPVSDFLVIYTLSGENRSDLADRPGRFVIRSGGDVIYAAELRMEKEQWSGLPDAAWLRQNFHLIYADWNAQ